MIRLAILADIHGNLPALEAVMADMQTFEPAHVVVAGDLINGAPFSPQVLETVTRQRWTAIRGNHEFYVLNHNTRREKSAQRGSPYIAWLAQTLSDWHAYLAAMPDDLTLYYGDHPPVRVMHGTPGDNAQAITPLTPDRQVIQWLDGVEAPLYIAGHYHMPFQRTVNEWRIVSPGPVGMPQDGLRRAHYIWLEGDGETWQVTPRAVEYDFERVEAAFQQQKVYQQAGIMALLTYLQLRYAYHLINSFINWYRDYFSGQPVTPARVQEFLAQPNVIWDYLPERYRFRREGLAAIDPAVVDEVLRRWTA